MISSREHLQYKMLIERVLLLVFYLVVFEKCCFKLIQMVDVLSNIGTVTRTFLAVENYDNNKSSTHVHSENMYQCIIYVRHTVKSFLRIFYVFQSCCSGMQENSGRVS